MPFRSTGYNAILISTIVDVRLKNDDVYGL